MTTQTLISRDERARTAIENAIRGGLKSPSPTAIAVTAQENHSGEPSLYVFVVMPSIRDIPNEAEQNRLVVGMLSALEQIDDPRFPYLYFGPQESQPTDNELARPFDEDA